MERKKKLITEEEFLEKLAATKGKFRWKLDKKKMLRAESDNMNFCPITAVQFNEGGVYEDVDSANGDFLKIDDPWCNSFDADRFTAGTIMEAADNYKSFDSSYIISLREKMLNVLGLNKKKKNGKRS